jgi:hypothetical protein
MRGQDRGRVMVPMLDLVFVRLTGWMALLAPGDIEGRLVAAATVPRRRTPE